MIPKQEIEQKADEFGIHIANVERDYVFGWLLKALFTNDYLSRQLVLKGGNCMRKAYFPNTRFSSDLDFSVQGRLDHERFKTEIDRACNLAETLCGVHFVTERNSFALDEMADKQLKVYKGRIYFRDFHGEEGQVIISVRVDVTEFDRIYLPTVTRSLIHPYSDAEICTVNLPCMALEELLANKLKCLIQRRCSFDLYDFVYATFFERSIPVDRGLILRTFLRKTIFEPSPGAAKEILLGLPLVFFRGAWERYIESPLAGRFNFDRALEGFRSAIDSIFGVTGRQGWGADIFFPSQYRNLIFEAAEGRRLLRLTYDGREREVEPYSLAYKRRQDGRAMEYFYAYDRTGGHNSTPGIKSFVRSGIQALSLSEGTFEPRYPTELSKYGEAPTNGYFSRPSFGGGLHPAGKERTRSPAGFGQDTYTIECPYCNKRFKRTTYSTTLNPHKDPNGYPCSGRSGYQVW